MSATDLTRQQWLATRDRLVAKGLFVDADASLSLRCPGTDMMGCGPVSQAEPEFVRWDGHGVAGTTAVHATAHAAVYALRPDVGAIAWGGGPFGARLADFGGAMPQIFDEQARHLGAMSPAVDSPDRLAEALRSRGNVVVCQGAPLCLGVTPTRLALNVELFEKCAKAYVLAVATGGRVEQLPWLVRRIANSRLFKDERRAADAYARGELPEESRAY